MPRKTSKKTYAQGLYIMKHPQYQEAISRYIDGDLDEYSTTQLFLHIAHCSHCKTVYQNFTNQRTVLEACYSELDLPKVIKYRKPLLSFLPTHLWHPFHLLHPFMRICLISLVIFPVSIVLINLYNHTKRPSPKRLATIWESANPNTMASPLSALVYYEEFSGQAIHSQFVRLTSSKISTEGDSLQYTWATYYESPLFNDPMTSRSTHQINKVGQ